MVECIHEAKCFKLLQCSRSSLLSDDLQQFKFKFHETNLCTFIFKFYRLLQLSVAIHFAEHISHFIFAVVSNLSYLACLIPKLHAKCAIKRALTVTYSMLQETKDLACQNNQTKPSVSFFVLAIYYMHDHDLRHTSHVVQMCRERALAINIIIL